MGIVIEIVCYFVLSVSLFPSLFLGLQLLDPSLREKKGLDIRPCLCTKKKCVQFHPQVNTEDADKNGWYIQCNHPKCTEWLLKDEAEDKRVNIPNYYASSLVSFDLSFQFLFCL